MAYCPTNAPPDDQSDRCRFGSQKRAGTRGREFPFQLGDRPFGASGWTMSSVKEARLRMKSSESPHFRLASCSTQWEHHRLSLKVSEHATVICWKDSSKWLIWLPIRLLCQFIMPELSHQKSEELLQMAATKIGTATAHVPPAQDPSSQCRLRMIATRHRRRASSQLCLRLLYQNNPIKMDAAAKTNIFSSHL